VGEKKLETAASWSNKKKIVAGRGNRKEKRDLEKHLRKYSRRSTPMDGPTYNREGGRRKKAGHPVESFKYSREKNWAPRRIFTQVEKSRFTLSAQRGKKKG